MPWSRTVRRGPWLPNEDALLLQLVRSQGPNNWVRISQHMQYRSPKQCRERYHQNLKPSLNHEPISADEGEVIEKMVREMGHRWAEIARRLGNRSDNAIKNWWNGSTNRRKRNPFSDSRNKTVVGPRGLPIPAIRTSQNSFAPKGHGQLDGTAPATSRLERRETSIPIEHISPTGQHWSSHGPRIPALRNSVPVPHMSGQLQPLQTTSLYSQNSGLNARPLPPPLPSPNALYPPFGTDSGPSPRNTLSGSYFDHPHRPLAFTQPSRDANVISPSTSEWSKPPSIKQAPSLVSDNLSTCSISPKTVPSPQPSIPARLEESSQHWAAEVFSYPRLAPASGSVTVDGRSDISPQEYTTFVPRSTDPRAKHDTHPTMGSQRVSPPTQYISSLQRINTDALIYDRPVLPSPSELSPNGTKDARMHVASIVH